MNLPPVAPSSHWIGRILLACLLAAAWPLYAEFDPVREYRESEAVAKQFPDPAGDIDSPAFRAPHAGFTSQEEMLQHIAKLSASSPNLRVRMLGPSQEKRAIPLLIFARPAAGGSHALAGNGKPTVLVIGQQHGNEPAGGEAALALASQLAAGPLASLLARINVLIVPRANPDGAFHFVRELADGTDGNRDHVLTQSPEGRALARVFAEYQPEVVLDCHEFSVARRWLEKFGGIQHYDALVQYATVANLPASLLEASEQWFRRPLIDSLEQAGYRTSWYYTTAYDPKDRRVSMGGVVPDTGRNIAGLRNAISFLIETRGVNIGRAHLKRRVGTTLLAMQTLLSLTAENAQRLSTLVRKTRAYVADQAGMGDIAVLSNAKAGRHDLTLLDPDTGATRIVTVDWRSALEIETVLSRRRPFAYLLPASEEASARRLQRLGVSVLRLNQAADLEAERYTIVSMDAGKKDDVRRMDAESGPAIVKIVTRVETTKISAAAGDFYVPLDQPLANLIAAALEPEAQSSFAANRVLTLPQPGHAMTLPLYRLAAARPVVAATVWEEP